MAIRFVCPRCKGTDLFVELHAAQAYIAGGEWNPSAGMECQRCWYRGPLVDFDTSPGEPPAGGAPIDGTAPAQAGPPYGRRFTR